MKQKSDQLSKQLNISKNRSLLALMKAELIDAVLKEVVRQGLTHTELAARSGLSRSSVTGILSGSLQKVTLDRIVRLVESVDLVAEIKIKRAA